MRLNHIAIAVENLDDAIKLYESILGVKHSMREKVEVEGVEVAKFVLDNCRIELMQPLSEKSPVSAFLKKRGPGIHHFAIEPDNFEKKQKELSKKVELIGQPHKGSEEMLIQFIHPKSTMGVLLELCKPSK